MNIILSKTFKNPKCLILPIFAEDKKSTDHLPKSLRQLLDIHFKQKSMVKKEGSSLITHSYNGNQLVTIIAFSFGKLKDLNHKRVRNTAAVLTKIIKSHKQKNISIIIPNQLTEYLQSFAEGLKLTDYHFAIHKTGEAKKTIQESEIDQAELINPKWTASDKQIIKEVITTCRAIKTTRDFVNNPPNIVSTLTFVQEAKKIAKENNYKLTIFNKKKIEQLKMGALLSVNSGSVHPAHLVFLEHNGGNKGEKPIILVGKGLIFDTGGINLKPSGYIEDMQLDMAGGALVLGVFRVLKKLGINKNVIGVVPVTDNSIGSKATKPGEIVTAYNGKTIEIMNTDAEGRLILADALSYVVDKMKPRFLIDFATLTGACMIALGSRYAGLYGQDDELIQKLKEAGEATDEGANPMPISDADIEAVKGNMADLNNAPKNRYSGAGKAAAFLQNFVGDSKWAHMDIAGTAWTNEPKPYEVNNATGYGIRLITKFLQDLE
jgi:leucyl aminopeptidase